MKWQTLFEDLRFILLVPLLLLLCLFPFCFLENSSLYVTLKLLLGILVFGGGGWLLMRKFGIPESAYRQWPPPSWRAAAFTLFTILAAVCFFSLSLTSTFWWPDFTPDLDMRKLFQATRSIFPLFAILSIFHAIGEELFFRAFLLNYLDRLFPWKTAVLLAALTFAALHLPPGVWRFLTLFYYALGMIAAYRVLGSFVFAVLFHLTINLTGHLWRYWRADNPDFHGPGQWFFYAVLANIACGGVFYLIWKLEPISKMPVNKIVGRAEISQ